MIDHEWKPSRRELAPLEGFPNVQRFAIGESYTHQPVLVSSRTTSRSIAVGRGTREYNLVLKTEPEHRARSRALRSAATPRKNVRLVEADMPRERGLYLRTEMWRDELERLVVRACCRGCGKSKNFFGHAWKHSGNSCTKCARKAKPQPEQRAS